MCLRFTSGPEVRRHKGLAKRGPEFHMQTIKALKDKRHSLTPLLNAHLAAGVDAGRSQALQAVKEADTSAVGCEFTSHNRCAAHSTCTVRLKAHQTKLRP